MELKELEDRITQHHSLKPAWQSLKSFLRRPGKRLRPLLFLLSYSLFDGRETPPPRAAFRIAGALELFHGFALIHDDLIDRSESRRGKPTLHRALENDLSAGERNAQSLALVLGDILFGFAMECFIDPELPPAHSQAAMRYFLRIAQETGMGQAAEIAMLDMPLSEIGESEIEQTYHLKTTRYTIECPLTLGALLAGADEETRRALAEFAKPLGLAFQIENDLHEVALLPDTAPDLAYDFHCGVKTLLLKRLYETLSAADQSLLIQALRNSQNPEGCAELARLVSKSGIVKILCNEVRQHFMASRRALCNSSLRPHQIAFLESVVEFIQSNRQHSESTTKSKGVA
ncbi:polyprenyl synthetase family protein [Cerasicoccus maritimus]|uniref:polyprenyl synthetase family protein n=1 Tax=Cerasicoccus maritimus TaxID=490089 RepID=UPI0028526BBB|nr:polyprenyl synthetase family protein [Cerasicoccus maritimus]